MITRAVLYAGSASPLVASAFTKEFLPEERKFAIGMGGVECDDVSQCACLSQSPAW